MTDPEKIDSEPKLNIEEYYLGSAVWPSDVAYQIDEAGQPQKIRADIILEGAFSEGNGASLEVVEDFRQHHDDLTIKINPGYDTTEGEKVPRTVRLIGWRELDEDDREFYERLRPVKSKYLVEKDT